MGAQTPKKDMANRRIFMSSHMTLSSASNCKIYNPMSTPSLVFKEDKLYNLICLLMHPGIRINIYNMIFLKEKNTVIKKFCQQNLMVFSANVFSKLEKKLFPVWLRNRLIST